MKAKLQFRVANDGVVEYRVGSPPSIQPFPVVRSRTEREAGEARAQIRRSHYPRARRNYGLGILMSIYAS